MTFKGEQLTIKGENISNNIFTENELTVDYITDPELFNLSTFCKQNVKLPFFRMIFNQKGYTNYCINGKSTPLARIAPQQHNLLLISPDQFDIKLDTEQDSDVVCINLNPKFLAHYLPTNHQGYHQLLYGLKHQAPALFSEQHMHITPQVNTVLQSLYTFSHSGFCGRLLLQSKVIELLALQLSQLTLLKQEQNEQQLNHSALNRMHNAREILIRDLSDELSLRKLAHMVGTNEFNLKKDFKAAFGNTVFGYLKQHKMELAKSLLMERKTTIAAVSSKIGYKHATHFSSAFKKHFGYLPNKIKMLFLITHHEWILSDFFAHII